MPTETSDSMPWLKDDRHKKRGPRNEHRRKQIWRKKSVRVSARSTLIAAIVSNRRLNCYTKSPYTSMLVSENF